MPIIIRELVVEAHITGANPSTREGATTDSNPAPNGLSEEIKLKIVREAVEQVMEIIERQKDR